VGVNGAGTGVAAQGRVGMDAFGTLVGALLKADGASSVAAKVTNSTVTGAARGLQSQVHSADGQAVVAEALATSGRTRGVEGIVRSPDGIGVYAENQATSPGGGNALAALSHTSSPTAVLANVSGGAAAAMYGAVEVRGDVSVSGVLSKAGGSFKIDHPLDPENKYLYHSFVESDEMMNIYAGNVVTDSNGRAEVQLPAWFEVLNRDFRYQLTTIGSFAQSMVEEELVANRFVIRTNVPHIKVSWQVTGVREDRWAEQHRIPVEQDKPEAERGKYLHPELFGQPKTLQVGYRPGLIQAPSDPPAKID
jgi:hypothetical protein